MGLHPGRMRDSPAAAAPLPSSVPTLSDASRLTHYTWRLFTAVDSSGAELERQWTCMRASQRLGMFALRVEGPSEGDRFESAPDGLFKGPAPPFFLFLRLCHTPRAPNN